MPIGPAPSSGGGGGGSRSGPVGPAPSGGGGGDKGDGGLLKGATSALKFGGILPAALMSGAKIGTRATEAVQAVAGLGSRHGDDQGRVQNARDALLRGEEFGVRGDGVGVAVANLGLDLVSDPTILLSGGAKSAAMGSRLLLEGGGEALARKAATKAGLTAAEKLAAKEIIAEQIAKGGAGDLAKRTLAEKATGRLRGLSGEEIATERALAGLVKEGRGGVRVAGKTVLSGETIRKAGDVVRKVPALEMADDAARALVVPRAGVTKEFGKATSDTLYGAQSEAAGKLETHIGESVRPHQAETKAAKVTDSDRKGPLLAALETGAPVEPRLQGTLDELVKQRAAATSKIVDRKLLPEEFLHEADAYVPRITTDEGFKAIAKAERKGQLPAELASLFKVSGALNARKILPDATIPEAEAVVQEMLKGSGIVMKAGTTFFEHDPVKAIVSHSAAVERASGQLGVLEHLASLPGGEGLVRIVESPTPKLGVGVPKHGNTPAVPGIDEQLARARAKVKTAEKEIAHTEGRLAVEGPARARDGAVAGLEAHTLDPVERLRLTQRLHDQRAAKKALESDVDALRLDRHEFGKANAAADAARKPPEGFEAIKIGEQTAYVHPELAREINRTKRLVDSGAATERLTRHIDEVQNFWRAQVTVLPLGTGFFARNFQGNLLLNAVDNVGLRDYAHALRLQRAMRKARQAGSPLEDALSAADSRLVREAEKHNVYNQGAQEADLNHVFPGERVGAFKGRTSALRGELTARDIPVIGTERGPVQAGRALNAVIENNARLANFIAGTRHSGHYAEAARRTRLTLFDYGDLTPAERAVGRRVVPFYTFARKSTGALLREIIHDPAKLNRISNVLQAVEETTGYGVDSPYDAAAHVLTAPLTPGAAKNTLGVGGYLGAAKQQIVGTTIQDKESGGFATIDPNAKQSESRAERLANALLPEVGKYGRVSRANERRKTKEGLLRLLLGISPADDPVARTPGGGQVQR